MTERSDPITNETLQKAVATELKIGTEEVDIISFYCEPGCEDGDNFSCDMRALTVRARVKSTLEEKTVHYMAKCLPNNELRDFMKKLGVWRSENEAFFKHLPAMNGILEPFGKSLSIPKAYFGSEQEEVIIMENLKTKGFVSANKIAALELDQLKMALEELSLFHSTSYKYVQTYPGGAKQLLKESSPILGRTTWLPTNDEKATFMNEKIQTWQNQLVMNALHSQSDADLTSRVKRYLADADKILEARLADPSLWTFACLNHGDAWKSNFMFRFAKDGQTDQFQLIDLQVFTYNRPSLDLTYFCAACLGFEQRKQNLKPLLKFYYNKLEENLKMLGYPDIYGYDLLQEDFRQCFPFLMKSALLHALLTFVKPNYCAVFSAIEATFSDDPDKRRKSEEKLNRVTQEETLKALKNEELKKALIQLILEADEWNVFN